MNAHIQSRVERNLKILGWLVDIAAVLAAYSLSWLLVL